MRAAVRDRGIPTTHWRPPDLFPDRKRSTDDMHTAHKISTGVLTTAIVVAIGWSAPLTGAQQASSSPPTKAAGPIVTVVRVIAQNPDRPVLLPATLLPFPHA